MAARSRSLLRAASQLCRLGLRDALPSELGSLTGAPRVLSALQGLRVQHRFNSTPAADAAAHQPEGPEQEAAAAHSGRRPNRVPRQLRRALFIPHAWEQQGAADADKPLVQELRALLQAGDAEGAKRAFEASLVPLQATLEQGHEPRPSEVPPPFAWKMYFSALAALGTHAHRLSDRLELMRSLGVPPQHACYVMALRRMAQQGFGAVAFTKIHQMKTLGLEPTLRCFTFAIEATLQQKPPELGYARKLFAEVAEQGLAVHPAQKANIGKLMLTAVREFARYRRLQAAFDLFDQLEALGLRVPAFVIADVTRLAALADSPPALLECVRRLERATQTFQEVPGVGEPITRPLKVEEGLLLSVLEVAASHGHVELAEAAWRVLERSVALPNTPSAHWLHKGRAAGQRGAEAHEEAAAGEFEDGGSEGEDAAGSEAAVAEQQQAEAHSRQLQALSAQLEASEAARAEEAEAAASRERHRHTGRAPQRPPPLDVAAAAAEAEAMAAERQGARKPSMLSHLAIIHAYARARQPAGMFEAVERLLQEHPEQREVAAYYDGLPMAVDGLARSVEDCDAAFDVLEGWAQQGRPVHVKQLNLVVAACCQIGDLKRAFATVDSFGRLGVAEDADTYNALMEGCLASGRVSTALDVHGRMEAAGLEPNAHTHHLLVEAGVVSGEVEAMMAGLHELQAAGHAPKAQLLERCLARAERAGDRDAARELLRLLLAQDYRIVGADAKARRWQPEGGMPVLTGSSLWFSREEVARELRKGGAIERRIARRQQQEQQQRRQQRQQRQSICA